jgi:Calcineurin-like phosphoesterase
MAKQKKSKSKSKGAVSSAQHKMKYRPRSKPNKNFKPQRPFGDAVSPTKPDPSFAAIPSTHKMPSNLSYDLSAAIGQAEISRINAAGQLVIHAVGDTGDINGLGLTKDLALQMGTQYSNTDPKRPSFFFHLGDVVYYNGVSTDYRDQFYDPYKFYPPVIFAIPGNHDGQVIVNKGDPPDPEPSLTGFFANFCDKGRNKTQSSPYRYTMNQPWPYWVLTTPFATIIGLYSNVDGSLDPWNDSTHPQFSWFISQLQNADKNKCLILAVHHSPFSLDSDHGGYPDILDAIDQAVAKSNGRYPDLILSGHVHNYQRFHRVVAKHSYIHIVAGAGGYASIPTMHQLQLNPKTNAKISINPPFQANEPGVTLVNYNEVLPGFLRISIDKQFIKGEYFVNDTKGGIQSPNAFDTFRFDYINKAIQ